MANRALNLPARDGPNGKPPGRPTGEDLEKLADTLAQAMSRLTRLRDEIEYAQAEVLDAEEQLGRIVDGLGKLRVCEACNGLSDTGLVECACGKRLCNDCLGKEPHLACEQRQEADTVIMPATAEVQL